jgi:hypothetical protein
LRRMVFRVYDHPHTVEVAGSNPAPPIRLTTIICAFAARYLHATRRKSSQISSFWILTQPGDATADLERVSGASTVAWAVDDGTHPMAGSPGLQVAAAVWMLGAMAPEARRGVDCLLRAPYRCGTMV